MCGCRRGRGVAAVASMQGPHSSACPWLSAHCPQDGAGAPAVSTAPSHRPPVTSRSLRREAQAREEVPTLSPRPCAPALKALTGQQCPEPGCPQTQEQKQQRREAVPGQQLHSGVGESVLSPLCV